MYGIRREQRTRSLLVALAIHGLALWLVFGFAHTRFIRASDTVIDVFEVRPDEPPPPLPVQSRSAIVPEREAAAAPTRPAPFQSIERPAPALPSLATAGDLPGPENGGVGPGTGPGASGTGTGGLQPVTAPRLRGGEIEPRDYPRAANGAQGTVNAHLAIAADGRVAGCTVTVSSGNTLLDATTCRLIRERFRFTPARNAQGEAVPGEYGWLQRWWRD